MTLTDEQLQALSGHTPGPWYIGWDDGSGGLDDPDPGGIDITCNKHSEPDYEGDVRDVIIRSGDSFGLYYGLQDPQANAALIAAAPDLLHEVREARAEVKRLKGTEAALRMMVEGYSKRIEEVLNDQGR